MQRGRAILVLRMNVRTCIKQQLNRRHLALCIPRGILQVTIGGIMQRLTATMIHCSADIRVRVEQQLRNLQSIDRRGDMQRRIARVNPVRDFSRKNCLCRACRGQRRVLNEQLLHPPAVIGENRPGRRLEMIGSGILPIVFRVTQSA